MDESSREKTPKPDARNVWAETKCKRKVRGHAILIRIEIKSGRRPSSEHAWEE